MADAGPFATATVESLNAVVPATIYLVVVRRVRRGGGAWPARRTAVFLTGVTLAALATSSAADEAARRSLAWHMTVQMALLLLVGPAVVAGHPLALLRRVAGRRMPRPPGPAVAWIGFVGVQWVVHVPAVTAFGLREPSAFALMHWLLIGAGVAFFAQIASARLHPLALALYIASAMPTTDAIALWLLLDPRIVYANYAGSGGLADQQAAGAIMFGAGNVLLVAAAWIAGRYLWSGRPGPAAGYRRVVGG